MNARARLRLISRSGICCLAIASMTSSACKKKEEPKAEPEKPAVAPEPESTKPVHIDLSGPKPPEVSATFFVVNGALMPIACFDAATKKLRGGPDCGSSVPAGSEVYLGSETGAQLDKVGDAKHSLCEVEGTKPTSFGAASLNDGANYDYAVWPRPTASLVQLVPTKTQSNRKAKLDEAQNAAIAAEIAKYVKSDDKGELRSNQKAELDIDGDGQAELFISASLAHPSDPDQLLFSGLWMAPSSDLSKLQLIDRSRGKLPETVLLRGAIDLDGDGRSELWATLTFEGGAGDRVYTWEKGEAKALTKWSCGA